MKRLVANRFMVFVTIILLTGCSSGYKTACPSIRDYTPEFQSQLADEVQAAPHDAAWPTAIEDYIGLRDQIRAACDTP